MIAPHTGRHAEGHFVHEAPIKCMNREKSKGLKTNTSRAYYQISADLGETITTYNSTLILSYIVKNEQDEVAMGGAFVKLLPQKHDQHNF